MRKVSAASMPSREAFKSPTGTESERKNLNDPKPQQSEHDIMQLSHVTAKYLREGKQLIFFNKRKHPSQRLLFFQTS